MLLVNPIAKARFLIFVLTIDHYFYYKYTLDLILDFTSLIVNDFLNISFGSFE